MSRLITPLIFGGTAAYVWWFNTNHADRAVFVPGLDVLFPALAGDPIAQGAASLKLLLGLTAVTFVFSVVGMIRDRSQKKDE